MRLSKPKSDARAPEEDKRDNLTAERTRKSISPLTVITLGLAGLALTAFVGILVPLWLVPDSIVKDAAQRITLQNQVRQISVPATAGVLFLVTAYFTWRQVSISTRQMSIQQRQLLITRDEQISGRLYSSFEYLGSDSLEVRIGAIYTLDRLLSYSPDDCAPVMRVLATYIRQRAPWPPTLPGQYIAEANMDGIPSLAVRTPDVQAAINVIGKWNEHLDYERLDLSSADLRRCDFEEGRFSAIDFDSCSFQRASLSRGKFDKCSFEYSDLSGATLFQTDITRSSLRDAQVSTATNMGGANFTKSDLSHLDFSGCLLSGAQFRHTKLNGSNFSDAIMHGADLKGAIVNDAQFCGAKIQGADISSMMVYRDNSATQLAGAKYDEKTVMPGGFDPDSMKMTYDRKPENLLVLPKDVLVETVPPWEEND